MQYELTLTQFECQPSVLTVTRLCCRRECPLAKWRSMSEHRLFQRAEETGPTCEDSDKLDVMEMAVRKGHYSATCLCYRHLRGNVKQEKRGNVERIPINGGQRRRKARRDRLQNERWTVRSRAQHEA
jgi:hypothetical protein